MNSNNVRISARQLRRFIIVTIVGVGILTMPRDLVELAGPDGWMILLLSGATAMALGIVLHYLGKKFPGQTIIEYSRELVGRPGSILIGIAGIAYYIMFSAVGLRIFGEVLKMFLLPRTPIEVISITFLLSIVYLVRNGLEGVARFYEFIFLFMLITFVLALVAGVEGVEATNLLPVFQTSPRTIVKGTYEMLFSFIGFETIFLYIPFVSDKENTKKSILTGIGVVTFLYLFSTGIVLANFGVSETKELVWPLMSYIKSVEVPGGFIEQLEGVIMTIWVLFIYTTLSSLYFSGSFIFSRVTGIREHKIFVMFLLPIIYVLSLLPENVAQVYDWAGVMSMYMGTTMVVIIPLLLLIVAIIRKKGVKANG